MNHQETWWLRQREQRADMGVGGVGARQDFGDGLMTGQAIIWLSFPLPDDFR